MAPERGFLRGGTVSSNPFPSCGESHFAGKDFDQTRLQVRRGRSWCRHVERLPRSRDVLGAPAVGEETVVPDAVETVGQDVDQKAAVEAGSNVLRVG